MLKPELTLFLLLVLIVPSASARKNKYVKEGYKLVWSDEFKKNGVPDTSVWNFETGFLRNREDQWYQPENAYCLGGCLVIEGRKEHRLNPGYNENSNNWRHGRKFIEYTSASLNTRNKKEFQYGRFEIRAKIDTAMGLWPAIWTLGRAGEWPSCGEIDIMESYPINNVHHILANVACGTHKRYNAKWNSAAVPLSHFLAKDPDWPSKFHVWRMDWDEEVIRLYLDDELLNETYLKDAYNADGTNPFNQPHYILLNLAIGGDHGGTINNNIFPTKYQIDYVRVYQRVAIKPFLQ
ncbi:MAG: glycoside hydrolase family 16 protein [Paludibacter sp.]|nr:glycoside hydrolase family 16 protein [Paludibacter sp.]